MKLRIYGDSLRLRLSRGEVARVAAGEAIEASAALLPQPLVYRLVAGDRLDVRFADGALSVTAAADALRRWAAGDDVSLGGDAGAIRVLIEKDFQCLHGDGTDQPDCFPNPLANATP